MIDENIALVIGNGESRKNINLQKYTGNIVMYGCNAVHRDAIVDYLICCDQRMVSEAILDVNTSKTLIYTRQLAIQRHKSLLNLRLLPEAPPPYISRKDQSQHWGSGSYALFLASMKNFKKIYVLGFDLYGNGRYINNLYKDTKNYKKSPSPAIDPSYWIYQCAKVFKMDLNKKFIIVNESSWTMPNEWSFPNIDFLDINYFERALHSQ